MGGYVGIPASYTPVEYIESTGTQYIDTGFLPNSNTSVILEAKIPSSRSSNITRFFESRNEASSVTGAFGVISFNDNNKLLQIRYDASTNLSNGQLTTDVKHKISMQKNQLYIDDVLKITASTATFQTNYSLLIFGFHTPSAKQNAEGVYLLYSFKIYDNGTLVRDYIPVIDQDNVACLYDLVEDKFYYNQGSGSFTAGSTTGQPVSIGGVARKIKKAYAGIPASYTPVEYIESSGTQWIDTGVNALNNEMELKFQYTGLSSTTYVCGSSDGTNRFGLIANRPANNDICYGDKSNNYYTLGAADTNEHTVVYNNSSNQVVYDGVVKGTLPNLTTQVATPLGLFALSGTSGGASFAYTRIMYCKITDKSTNTLIRSFIPVINQDNVACLYELVEGKFYHNKGAGTFTAGSTTGSPVSIGNVAREIQKGYVGVPTSYTPVDYIESSGTQYVDTGFKMSNNSKIVAKLSMADANIMTAVGVGGSYQSFSIQSYNGNYRIRWRSGATSNIQVDSSIPIGTTPHIFEANSTNAKIDGTVIGSTNSYQFTESSNLFICAMSSNNSPLNLATGRIYYYQIYEYDVLVKSFIPVIDQDNVACLYEQVEGKFYYNKGTGTFTAGSTTGQEVVLSSVARLCYSASSLPDTALLLCHLDDSSTNEITGNDAAPTNGIQSYSTGKWDKAATIRATAVDSDYNKTTHIYSLRDTNLPNVYNVLNGSASPVTVTGWFKSGTNDGWIFAYGYWYYIRYGAQTNYSYRCGVGVALSNNYLQAKIMYRTSGSGSPLTASLTTDVANTVYADGNWHHYAIEVDSTGMNFYFDGVYKGHVNKPSGFLSDGFSNTVHFSLGDEIMVCSGLLYNQNNFTPPPSPY